MNIDILINQIDEHNESNILATKKYNPKEVLFLYEKRDENTMNVLEDYYKNKFNNIKLKKMLIDEDNIEIIKNVFNQNKDKEILINLTGGRRVNSLMLLSICIRNNIKSIYIDYKGKKIYEMEENLKKIDEKFEDLELENILEATGGEVIDESTNLIEKEDIKILTKFIYNNLEIWHKYKQKIYDQQIFSHDYKDSKKVTINLEHLNEEDQYLLNKILEKLKELNGILYFKKDYIIEVIFQNEYLKSFLFKSGTWLEVASNILIKEISEIDEVKSGVIFLWNNKDKTVKNEVDVVLVKDSVITCISCKDSSKYNEDALNELNIYANKIGGEKSNKILVSTRLPEKISINQRAKEMGIDIVIFDGNTEIFKEEIKRIIRKTN